jgi:hypothetical protein
MKRWIALLILGAAMVLSSMSVSATDEENGTHHFNFQLTSPDRGSCSNVWAVDTFSMDLTVRRMSDTTFAFRRAAHGTFVTTGSVSPGACDPGKHHGQLVRAGVNGHFQSDVKLVVTSTVFNPDATCGNDPNECFDLIFGDGVTGVDFVSFSAQYAAGDQDLIYEHWFEGVDLADDHGDIASS